MKIIKKNTTTDCYLCERLAHKHTDPFFIMELKYGSLFLHPNQCFRGRALFALNEHFTQYPEIDIEVFQEFNNELLQICQTVKKLFVPEIINYASLGNEVRHFHYHIIPRYLNDQNWGGPPWPNEEKNLRLEEYQELTNKYRVAMRWAANDWNNQISNKAKAYVP